MPAGRSRAIGAAVLAALVVGGGFTVGAPAASAAPAPAVARADQLKGLVAKGREHIAQRMHARAAARSASVAPADCLTAEEGEQVADYRYAGADRYETAACVSYWNWLDYNEPDAPADLIADAVVLARGDLFPDALAGGPLAAQVEGPLLLTTPTSLRTPVQTEIQRVLAPGGTVYLLGGTGSLSSAVEQTIQGLGYHTVRLAGTDRFQTAVKIADAMPDTSRFFFTTGMNFPDALAAGGAAAALTYAARYDDDPADVPFALLFTNDASMPAVTRNFANQRGQQFGVWTLITAGGGADQAAVASFGTANLSARLVGADRFATTTKVAEAVYTDSNGILVGPGVGLADGMNFPDALAATAELALYGEPLLLTQPTTLSSATRQFLQQHAGQVATPAILEVMGGTSVVSDPVKNAAVAAFTPAG